MLIGVLFFLVLIVVSAVFIGLLVVQKEKLIDEQKNFMHSVCASLHSIYLELERRNDFFIGNEGTDSEN